MEHQCNFSFELAINYLCSNLRQAYHWLTGHWEWSSPKPRLLWPRPSRAKGATGGFWQRRPSRRWRRSPSRCRCFLLGSSRWENHKWVFAFCVDSVVNPRRVWFRIPGERTGGSLLHRVVGAHLEQERCGQTRWVVGGRRRLFKLSHCWNSPGRRWRSSWTDWPDW